MSDAKSLRTVPKISVKVWRPIIDKLDAKLEAACLRRDAYLKRVLEVELGWLESEVALPNSRASFDFVFENLDALDRKLVSLALPHELTGRLNEVCSRKRIVRDAFFNRLFLLLSATPRVVDALLFPTSADEWRREVWSEYKHDGPFFQNGFYPLEQEVDPFWAIRSGLELLSEGVAMEDYVEPASGATIRLQRDVSGDLAPLESIYSTFLHQKHRTGTLLGLNCYVPDWRIPGSAAEQRHHQKLDEILGDWEALK
jgi:hypothetical protein